MDVSCTISHLRRDASHRSGYRAAHGLRGLVFDLEGVICDGSAWRRRLWQLLDRIESVEPYDDFMRALDNQCMAAVYSGQREFLPALELFLRERQLSPMQIGEISASPSIRHREGELHSAALPGVVDTLALLHRTCWQLALLADTDLRSCELHEHTRQLGVDRFVQVTLGSCDIGHSKPSTVGFSELLRLLDLPADAVAFVSRTPRDLAAARSIGLRTIACGMVDNTAAEITMAHISELPEILADEGPTLPSAATSTPKHLVATRRLN